MVIYDFILENMNNPIVIENKKSELNPGVLNKILVAFFILVLKFKRKEQIEIFKASLEQKGIKITFGKLFSRI